MTSIDSNNHPSRGRFGYEQFALGFVGLCVVGMYFAAALSPVKRAMYSLPPAPAVSSAGHEAAAKDAPRSASVFAVAPSPETPVEIASVEMAETDEPASEPVVARDEAAVLPYTGESTSRSLAEAYFQGEAVAESVSENARMAVTLPPLPARKPAYVPSVAHLILASGDSLWRPERRSVAVVSPPSGGPGRAG